MNNIEKIKEGLNDAVNWGHITHSFANLIIQTIKELQRELAIEQENVYNKRDAINRLEEELSKYLHNPKLGE